MKIIAKNVALLLVLSVTIGCATINDVAYTPQPARIENPREEVKSLILANTVQGCVSEPDVTDKMIVVKFVCTNGGGGVGNMVVRLDSVESITMQESGGWYRVLVHHKSGADDFTWTSKSLDDMQRLADALTALAAAASSSSAPPPAEGAPAAI